MPYSLKINIARHLAIVGVVLVLAATGCQTSTWSSKNMTGEDGILGEEATAEQTAATSATETTVAATETPQQIMADVRELGAINPAAQAALMQELEKADPAIWSSVVQNFRSRMAYGDQVYQQEMLAAASQNPAAQNQAMPNAGPSAPMQQGPQYVGGNPYYTNQPIPAHTNAYPPATQPVAPTARPPQVQPLPYPYPQQPNNAHPGNMPQGSPNPSPNTLPKTMPPGYPYSSVEPIQAKPTDSGVLLAGYEESIDKDLSKDDLKTLGYTPEKNDDARPLELAPKLQPCPSGDWQASLNASIEALQKKLESSKDEDNDATTKRDQLRLRFLLLAAGRNAEAMEPIPDESEAMADFWASQMFGLSTLLDERKADNLTLRNALAKHKLGESLDHLGKASDLAVRNLSFCKAVDGFANIKPFEKYEFQPGEEVILYAELDNLKYEETVEGYKTSLQIGYKIFDASDRLVEDQQSGCSDECSSVLRRDFYVSQRLRLPERLYPGRHVLKLTVEDRLGRKYGESIVEFTVK